MSSKEAFFHVFKFLRSLMKNLHKGDQQDKLSFGRYGLQAALVGSQIYIFAGKKNYKECVNDLVFLETKTPIRPVNLRLMKGTSRHTFVIDSSFKRKLAKFFK